ncbi:uncharacterized protein TRIADDRAFT_32406 [Trichoplax adhaerens]|uniref:Peroxisomal membrane protein PEX16 n=1 Tax=Trichoplax adhaerens TaxID=10228 RepID=B3SAX0_TRIAD|nr:hypothetical protein TRIADDRAFT_32406 [Trichoplax adhaerens]EDV20176.1 hypothetical protein TRIADDRAFT_32406 [Trichoplax adhaerens]|eukprot:XP_002117337.1 hypothetical protein TRIADDRAFT_32406 [Trichoplax adhaerens]
MASGILHFITAKWQEIATNYRDLIIKDPEIASRIEAILRMVSYLIQGKFPFSQEISELVYTASNLLTLTNDEIYRHARKLANSASVIKIKRWLTVVEYVEVFIEVGSARLLGDFGRWVVVLMVQILKAAMRLVLVFKHKDGIQCRPTIAPMKRDSKTLSEMNNKQNMKNDPTAQELPVWKGERSGRFVRSLSAGNRRQYPNLDQYKMFVEQEPTPLTERQKLAELLYTVRPVLHILSMFTFGQNSWKPWLISTFTDLSRYLIAGDTTKRTFQERQEISRRYMVLLLYLLRSPCYDNYSREKVIAILGFLSRYIPGSSLIIGPLIEYLPYWQKTYSYNWTS